MFVILEELPSFGALFLSVGICQLWHLVQPFPFRRAGKYITFSILSAAGRHVGLVSPGDAACGTVDVKNQWCKLLPAAHISYALGQQRGDPVLWLTLGHIFAPWPPFAPVFQTWVSSPPRQFCPISCSDFSPLKQGSYLQLRTLAEKCFLTVVLLGWRKRRLANHIAWGLVAENRIHSSQC